MEFWRQVFCEDGEPSSKRIVGTVTIAVVLASTLLLTVREGGTMVVQGLLQTEMIMGGSLIGLSTVTGCFRSNEPKE